MSRLLDPKDKKTGKFPFEYRDASKTDVRVTWQRYMDERKSNEEERKEKIKVLTSKAKT